MPLTLTLTEGILTREQATKAVRQLTDTMLELHDLTGNSVMTPNVTANVHFVPEGLSFSGGEPFRGAWVEWKVPSFAFATREVQEGFGASAADIIHELSGGSQPKENVYFNVVHTVDGTWNLDGRAMTNEELGEAISKG
ncbi:MAG TPA: 4-oxalocrotonate tautomerase [Planctomycetes bacterium]|nr:4-oxalocrotonate tautomerase [Planctomycetota bacterium]